MERYLWGIGVSGLVGFVAGRTSYVYALEEFGNYVDCYVFTASLLAVLICILCRMYPSKYGYLAPEVAIPPAEIMCWVAMQPVEQICPRLEWLMEIASGALWTLIA